MKLHLQKTVNSWAVVDVGRASFRRSKPLLEQINQILGEENRLGSKQRKCSGFHVVLEPDEKASLYRRIRALHEPLRGELTDEHVKRVLSDMMEKSDCNIKVYGYNALQEKRISKRKAELEPDFCFAMR